MPEKFKLIRFGEEAQADMKNRKIQGRSIFALFFPGMIFLGYRYKYI